jgi:hypothetical protein
MAKLAILGQDPSYMVDCSEVIPQPKPLPAANRRTVFPPGFTNADVDQAVLSLLFRVDYFADRFVCQCASIPFPYLQTSRCSDTSIASG